MQTIKNKQTGETLTGDVLHQDSHAFRFRINGCAGTCTLELFEWDVLPPPLPTGIGAVVDTIEGHFIQVQKGVWRTYKGNLSNFDDAEVYDFAPITILSPGVLL